MMFRERLNAEVLSEFMKYLATIQQEENGDRLPSLAELSQQLGISIASLREQLEVARALGLVEVRPKTGIRRLPYTFRPAVAQSLAYALAVNPINFEAYSDLRNNVESAYWYQAVCLLTSEDQEQLRDLVARAMYKIRGKPAQIPHEEHRELHLLIYRRLDNPFVSGILEAYWEMYVAVGLDVYTDLDYLERVWQYHERMVDAICAGNFAAGFQALREHMDLLVQRAKPTSRQKFE